VSFARPEWLHFENGDQVVLEFPDGYKTAGFVSDVMPDGTAIWVHLAGGGERRLFCPSDQIVISRA